MAELQIKNQSLPKRCDICHQQDYFDAQTNTCLRCNNINAIAATNNQPAIEQQATKLNIHPAILKEIRHLDKLIFKQRLSFVQVSIVILLFVMIPLITIKLDLGVGILILMVPSFFLILLILTIIESEYSQNSSNLNLKYPYLFKIANNMPKDMVMRIVDTYNAQDITDKMTGRYYKVNLYKDEQEALTKIEYPLYQINLIEPSWYKDSLEYKMANVKIYLDTDPANGNASNGAIIKMGDNYFVATDEIYELKYFSNN